MKKCIMPLLAFVLCLSFTGCSLTNSKPLEPESGIKIIREEDTSDEEDEESDETNEDDSEPTETTSNLGYKSGDYAPCDISIEATELCNSKNVVVWAEELIGDPADQYTGLVLYIGNDTSQILTLRINEMYVNNYLITEDLDDVITIDAGKDDNKVITFYKSQMENLNIDEIGQISLGVSVLTESKYELVKSELIDIPTSLYDEMKEPTLRKGDILAGDNEDILAAFYSSGPGYLGLYVYNRTEKEMKVTGTDLTIAGKNYGDIIHMTIPPGKAKAYYYDLDTSYYIGTAYDRTDITSVSAKVAYRTTNSIEPIWESDSITVDLSK